MFNHLCLITPNKAKTEKKLAKCFTHFSSFFVSKRSASSFSFASFLTHIFLSVSLFPKSETHNLLTVYSLSSFFLFSSTLHVLLSLQCIRDEMGKGCSEETVNYADDKISKASQESLDLTCKNYEEFSTNCLSLPLFRRNKKKTHISYLPALVDIFTNL